MDAFERLRQWVAAEFGVSEPSVTRETTLGDLLQWLRREAQDASTAGHPSDASADSLDRIELVMRIEECLDLEFPDRLVAEGPEWKRLLLDERATLGQLEALIERSGGEG